MNFFQRYLAKQASEIEMPAVELPSSKEVRAEPADMIEPIHVDDAQYLQLTRALRPVVAPLLEDLAADSPGSNVPGADGASSPTPADPRTLAPEQPPGTPIV